MNLQTFVDFPCLISNCQSSTYNIYLYDTLDAKIYMSLREA